MEKLILVFDTETTGLPDWKKPSGDDSQPHIVQLGAALMGMETRKIVQGMNVIVRPDGWEIPQEVTDIHGISHDYAMDVGIPEDKAIDIFLELWGGRTRVAHNTTFDNRIIRIATKRYCDEDVIDAWKQGSQEEEWICTMIAAGKIMGKKRPSLQEAHKYFTGEDIKNAHTAWGDMMSCAKIYWAMQGVGK